MELRHLRYFLAVAEELHFARAAERLHLAQQPLSFQIKQLEQELGVQLFERTTRRVRLTKEGEIFVEEVRKIMSQLARGIDTVKRAARGEVGRLVIGYTNTMLYHLIPRAVRAFRARFPQVEILLRELCSTDIEKGLVDGDLDVGLLVPTLARAGLVYRIVHREPVMIAMPRGHEFERQEVVMVKQLAGQPFLMYEKSYIRDQIIGVCRSFGFSPMVVQEALSEQAIIGLVAAGLGVSVVSACLNNVRSEEVSYRPMVEPEASLEWAIVWRQGRRSPVVEAFQDVVQDEMALTQQRVASSL